MYLQSNKDGTVDQNMQNILDQNILDNNPSNKRELPYRQIETRLKNHLQKEIDIIKCKAWKQTNIETIQEDLYYFQIKIAAIRWFNGKSNAYIYQNSDHIFVLFTYITVISICAYNIKSDSWEVTYDNKYCFNKYLLTEYIKDVIDKRRKDMPLNQLKSVISGPTYLSNCYQYTYKHKIVQNWENQEDIKYIYQEFLEFDPNLTEEEFRAWDIQDVFTPVLYEELFMEQDKSKIPIFLTINKNKNTQIILFHQNIRYRWDLLRKCDLSKRIKLAIYVFNRLDVIKTQTVEQILLNLGYDNPNNPKNQEPSEQQLAIQTQLQDITNLQKEKDKNLKIIPDDNKIPEQIMSQPEEQSKEQLQESKKKRIWFKGLTIVIILTVITSMVFNHTKNNHIE